MLGPLRWVLLYVSDLEKMSAFYKEKFDLETSQETDRYVIFKTGDCIFELMGKFDNGPEALDDSKGWDRNKILMSFQVDDIRDVVAKLEARGLKTEGGIRPTVAPEGEAPIGWLAQFMDPEGNLIEICQEPLEA